MKIIAGVVIGVLLFQASLAQADNAADTLSDLRREAHQEHVKEEEIQMMRLELEKLKVEAETRKILAEMGPSNTGISTAVARVNMDIKNIVIDAHQRKAVLDVGGIRQSVGEGDMAGGMTVKTINPGNVVLVDDHGQEQRVEVHR